jgi:hypothetical protein
MWREGTNVYELVSCRRRAKSELVFWQTEGKIRLEMDFSVEVGMTFDSFDAGFSPGFKL